MMSDAVFIDNPVIALISLLTILKIRMGMHTNNNDFVYHKNNANAEHH